MSIGRAFLGLILLIMVAGEVNDERMLEMQRDGSAGLADSAEWRQNDAPLYLYKARILDATPTPSSTPQEDAPEMDAGDTPAEEEGLVEGRNAVGTDAGQGGEVAVDSGNGSGISAIITVLPWDADTALAISYCESKHDPTAISWDGRDFGLWQIRDIHSWRWPDFWESWMNPQRNTEWAWELYQESGWTPWACWGY